MLDTNIFNSQTSNLTNKIMKTQAHVWITDSCNTLTNINSVVLNGMGAANLHFKMWE